MAVEEVPRDRASFEHDRRWACVVARDRGGASTFVYGVKTTKIYCRVGCPARTPLRKNVVFFLTPELARSSGFRSCKRCRPDRSPRRGEVALKVTAACRTIESAENEPSLALLASEFGSSISHFQRTFKAVMGISPKAYAQALRGQRVSANLSVASTSVTEAIYNAGYGSNSRFYETATRALGMTPSRFRKGGAGVRIMFAIGECSLGSVLVACSAKGVCAILLGDDAGGLLVEFEKRFPKADLIGGDKSFERLVALVVGFIDSPKVGLDLPLDLRGTAFQQRVWRALCDIPVGKTESYGEVAKRIGAPSSYRAVARACGANSIAVAVPCHRVVRSDGGISGYRWGICRKRDLLKKEQAS